MTQLLNEEERFLRDHRFYEAWRECERSQAKQFCIWGYFESTEKFRIVVREWNGDHRPDYYTVDYVSPKDALYLYEHQLAKDLGGCVERYLEGKYS